MKSVMFDLWHSSLLTMHVDLKSIKVKKNARTCYFKSAFKSDTHN